MFPILEYQVSLRVMGASSFVMRRITFFALFFAIFQLGYADGVGIKTPTLPEETSTGDIGKKPLHKQSADYGGNVDPMGGRRCSERDISIIQETSIPLPNGVPQYTVQILNTCASGCSISDIHVQCGWFSSARLINPRVFKRIKYDDCLVNNGEPLPNGRILSFQYATTFKNPLSVSHVSGC